MAKIPLSGQSTEGVSVDVDYQRSVNWYTDIHQNGFSQQSMRPTPGYGSAFTNPGTGPIRAQKVMNNVLYVVSGNSFYSVDTAGNASAAIGTLATTTGHVEMAHNGTEILIVDGNTGKLFNSTYSTFFTLALTSSGAADTDTENKLVNSGATFATDGVVAGMYATNLDTGESSLITAVDSETSLSLTADIFPLGTENYEVNSGDFPTAATSCAFIDGYFVVNDPANTNAAGAPGAFFISGSYQGGAYAALDYAVAERNWDQINAIRSANGQLWLVGSESTEVWWNSGNADFPFERIPSAVIDEGTVSGASVSKAGTSLIWLSQNDEGDGQVLMSQGFQVTKISSTGLDALIKGYTKTDARSYAMKWQGHLWYVLIFPTSSKTWVFDLSTGAWFQWAYNGDTGRHISNSFAFFNKKAYVGSYVNGKIYQLDDTVYDDDGTAITRLRQTPHFHFNGRVGQIGALELIFEQGVGTVSVTDPQVMLQWSKDRGHTWSSENWKDILGNTGEYSKASTWRKLGRCSSIIFRIKITDAVKPVLAAGFMRAETGELDVS